MESFNGTRSCAALRAADLDWIVGPEYSLGRNKQKRHPGGVTTDLGGGRAGISKNVTKGGSQLTF